MLSLDIGNKVVYKTLLVALMLLCLGEKYD